MSIIPMSYENNTVGIEKGYAEMSDPRCVAENSMRKIIEAKLVNEGLSELENGETIDGDSVRARIAEKYGF